MKTKLFHTILPALAGLLSSVGCLREKVEVVAEVPPAPVPEIAAPTPAPPVVARVPITPRPAMRSESSLSRGAYDQRGAFIDTDGDGRKFDFRQRSRTK